MVKKYYNIVVLRTYYFSVVEEKQKNVIEDSNALFV